MASLLPRIAWHGDAAVPGDLDGDRKADVALVGGNLTTIPLVNSIGNGAFANVSGSARDTQFYDWARQSGAKPVSGDFDGDGKSDIALTGVTGWGAVRVAFSYGNGTTYGAGAFRVSSGGMTAPSSASDSNFPLYATQAGAKPVAGDFDGDGYADIALTGGVGWSTIPVAFSDGAAGTFHGTNQGISSGDPSFTSWATQTGAKPVAGDFDGDGRSDIALVGGSNWIPIAFSNGDGTFRVTRGTVLSGDLAFPSYASNAGVQAIAGDFNGDGLADIALVGGAGWTSIPVAFSWGSGNFTATNGTTLANATDFPARAGDSGVKVVSGDFNGDGLGDIGLVGGAGWTTIRTALSWGSGNFTGTNAAPTGDNTFVSRATDPGVTAIGGF